MKKITILILAMTLVCECYSQVKSVGGGMGLPDFGEAIVEFKFNELKTGDNLQFFVLDFSPDTSNLKSRKIQNESINKNNSFISLSISEFQNDLAFIAMVPIGVRVVPIKLANYKEYSAQSFETDYSIVNEDIPLAVVFNTKKTTKNQLKSICSIKKVNIAKFQKMFSDLNTNDKNIKILYYRNVRNNE